jgi:hypothetical protein
VSDSLIRSVGVYSRSGGVFALSRNTCVSTFLINEREREREKGVIKKKTGSATKREEKNEFPGGPQEGKISSTE